MKPSNYNFFFPYEEDTGKMIAYNSFSGALALMDNDKHGKFMAFADGGMGIDDEEFVAQLKKGKFVIDDDCDELDLLRYRMLKSRYNTDLLNLIITPTSDCNFRCSYCFEKDTIKPDYMTTKIEDAIIKLVEGRINALSNLFVLWYGGEGLMNIETLERLSRKLIAICEKNNVGYTAHMITNGYLLTRETVQLLNELKVVNLQITLDGCEDIHNQRRPLADGSGTFSTIISNLETCKDLLNNVALRINTDKTNLDAGKKITQLLTEKGLLDKVKPYLAKVFTDDNELDVCGFAIEKFNYLTEFADDDGYLNYYPRAKSNVCSADMLNSYVVAADGRLYRCLVELGDHSKCTGSLIEEGCANDSLYLDYMLFDPTLDNGCSQCKLLPVCMGGCSKRRHAGEETCDVYKYVLDKFLGGVAKKLKRKRDAK